MSKLGDTIQQLRTLQQSYDAIVQSYNNLQQSYNDLAESITVPIFAIGMPSYDVDNTVAQVQIAPNTLYTFYRRTNDLTISFIAGDPTKTNEYHFIVQIGDSVPTITLPSSVDFTFDINDNHFKINKIYEFSILNNAGLVCEW